MTVPYDRKDYDSIFSFLKEKAVELSSGKWTDFSEGDIGTVFLHLMSYLADMNNYQTDKTTSELYLDTAIERTDIMSMLKLIGYEPRHFLSAYTYLDFEGQPDKEIPDGTVLPSPLQFTAIDNSIVYTILSDVTFYNNKATALAYEGTYVRYSYTRDNISDLGRIYLPDYNVGMNTVQLFISTATEMESMERVENVEFTTGEYAFSVHVDRDARVYIQMPGFWKDIIDVSTVIEVGYLLSSGENGRIGSNIITQFLDSVPNSSNITINNPEPSTGGFHPETVEDLKISAPMWARTMNTIVTLDDFEQVAHNIPEIADTKALDYNYPDQTGFVQPDDAYKVQVYAVPSSHSENSLYDEDRNPTDACQKLMDYVDARRLASITMFYLDPIYILPKIEINIYMDKNDLRVSTVATEVKNFMLEKYGRGNIEIGQSLYGSRVGADILDEFPYITYVEIQAPDTNISADYNEFIDIIRAKFYIKVNDEVIINDGEPDPPVDPEDVSSLTQTTLDETVENELFEVRFQSTMGTIGSNPRVTNVSDRNIMISKIEITRGDTSEVAYTKEVIRFLSPGLFYQDTAEEADRPR